MERFRFPASTPQEQLWTLHQLDRDSLAYSIPLAYRVEGNLDGAALERAIHRMVDRHEALRTIFEETDGQLHQVVLSNSNADIVSLDFSDKAGSAEADADEVVERLTFEPFDLVNGPLFKARIIRVSENLHVVAFNFHHSVVDHIAIVQFAEELAALYRSERDGTDSDLPEPEIQNADFAIWQQQLYNDGLLDEELKYWTDKLQGAPGQIELQVDGARSDAGTEYHIHIERELTQEFSSLIRSQGASLFVALLTIYKILLYRLSGQTDITVGCPFANRGQVELEKVMGCLMGTFPLRTVLDPDESFASAVEKVKKTVLGAQDCQAVSFQKIVEAVRPPRLPGANPLYQTAFIVQEPPMELKLDGVTSTNLGLNTQTSKFDQSWWLWESDDGIRGLFEYDTSLHSELRARSFAESFRALIESVCSDPDRPISRLGVLPSSERLSLEDRVRRLEASTGADATVCTLFEATVASHGDKRAIEFADRSLTYTELESRSRALAGTLHGQYECRGEPVGVFMRRSELLPLALLGVLRAGGHYVPLDPDYPAERLEHIIENSGLRVAVTTGEMIEHLPDGIERYVAVDRFEELKEEAQLSSVGVEDLAYIIYTSGTTGVPKGVELEHRSVVNFLRSMAATPGLGAGDRLLALTTISFDISVLEILLPLTVGGTVVVAPSEAVVDPEALTALLDSARPTVIQATPATWRMLIDSGWNGSQDLRILCGGEAMPPDLASELQTRCAELWNMYGPTETTVWSSCQRMMPDDPVTVGNPIDGTLIAVLDSNLQPLPDGARGEICIGGHGLARGYHLLPELTEARFPFVDLPGASTPVRLYRTGDIGYRDFDGRLAVMGRNDDQVKVRGFRIELGEVESVLRSHPAVTDAVAAVKGESDSARLLAYVVMDEEDDATSSELRQYIGKSLPGYMVPSAITEIDQVPLGPSGKVDRRQLRDFVPTTAAVMREPNSASELAIARIWKDLLGVEAIGLDDTFFELGGHSLLGARAASLMEAELGTRVPPRELFFRNVEQLGELVDSETSLVAR